MRLHTISHKEKKGKLKVKNMLSSVGNSTHYST